MLLDTLGAGRTRLAMKVKPGDEERAVKRIVQLIENCGLRFDPPSQAMFYGGLLEGIARRLQSVEEEAYGFARRPSSSLALSSQKLHSL